MRGSKWKWRCSVEDKNKQMPSMSKAHLLNNVKQSQEARSDNKLALFQNSAISNKMKILHANSSSHALNDQESPKTEIRTIQITSKIDPVHTRQKNRVFLLLNCTSTHRQVIKPIKSSAYKERRSFINTQKAIKHGEYIAFSEYKQKKSQNEQDSKAIIDKIDRYRKLFKKSSKNEDPQPARAQDSFKCIALSPDKNRYTKNRYNSKVNHNKKDEEEEQNFIEGQFLFQNIAHLQPGQCQSYRRSHMQEQLKKQTKRLRCKTLNSQRTFEDIL